MRQFDYVIKDEVGIHARPAGMLVKEAKKFKSTVIIRKGDKSAEAVKLMALMGMGVKCGQEISVEITGDDEDIAYEAIKKFVAEYL